VDLRAQLAAPPPALDFVLPGLLAGTLGSIISPGGAGKSMMTSQIAISIACGFDHWAILGSNPAPGNVIIVAAEDPEVVLIRRLHTLRQSRPAAFGDEALSRLHILAVQGSGFAIGVWNGRALEPTDDLHQLAVDVRSLGPRLVAFDTLNRCAGGVPENDNGAMGRVVAALEQVIRPVQAAALVLHHTSKSTALNGQGDAQQAARGAGAITDNARFQLNLVAMTKDEALGRGVAKDERRLWVRGIVTKANFCAPIPDRWFHRGEGGVLTGREPPAVRTTTRRGDPTAGGRSKKTTGGRSEHDDIPF
jgi:RecA-family ATPase